MTSSAWYCSLLQEAQNQHWPQLLIGWPPGVFCRGDDRLLGMQAKRDMSCAGLGEADIRVRTGHYPNLDSSTKQSGEVFPFLQVGELFDIDTCPSSINDPANRGDISYADVIPNDEPALAVFQMLVKNTVQSPRLIDIPVDAVLDLFRRVSVEMICLALHRAQTAMLPE